MAMTMMTCSHFLEWSCPSQHQIEKGRLGQPQIMSDITNRTRNEEELRDMLHEAEERKQLWENHFNSAKMDRKSNAEAIRNITALRGVIKTLRWTLNMTDKNGFPITHPLD